ncbi:unnamed protein product, partial [Rotaria sp. Silwood2]
MFSAISNAESEVTTSSGSSAIIPTTLLIPPNVLFKIPIEDQHFVYVGVNTSNQGGVDWKAN